MSLLSGTLSPTRFHSLGAWPGEDKAASVLVADQFRPFLDGSETERSGWVDWRNPLVPVDPYSLCADGVATFGFRVDRRRIPAVVLRAHVDQRLAALKVAKDLSFVGKEARKSIEEEVVAELLPKVVPSMKVVTVRWNYKEGVTLVDGRSESVVGAISKSFGVNLVPVFPICAPVVFAGRDMGQEFLAWLWMRGLAHGGTSGQPNDQSACFVGDSVTLAAEFGEAKTLRLAKGNPAECCEAIEALSRGWRPTSAKMLLLSGDLEWTFTLDSETICPTSLKLPPSQGQDPYSRLSDRSFLVDELFAHLDLRFKEFLAVDREVFDAEFASWVASALEPVHEPTT